MEMNGTITRDEIREWATKFAPDLIRIRRHMHRYPELSFQEFETAAYISSELTKAGIEHQSSIGGTGIRAIVRGGIPGEAAPAIALRADFDALPITEATGLDFASTRPGVMHACGHDAHTAIVLTCARIVKALSDRFSGSIVFLFQPAEEKLPGGAQAMIGAGALEKPKPASIIGEHVNPGLSAGTIGFRPGLMMASVDDILVKICGKGGHGAGPHLTIDPITVAAQIIVAAQQVVSRMANPETPTVLTFGKISGEGATNVIPETVNLEGTFRTIDETWRAVALERIRTIIKGVAAAFGAEAEVEIRHGYPAVHNDKALCERLRKAAEDFAGKDKIVDLPLVMWAEDFAYYGAVAPSCFYNIGVANFDNGWTSPLHSPKLIIDETALEPAAGLMAWLAVTELRYRLGE